MRPLRPGGPSGSPAPLPGAWKVTEVPGSGRACGPVCPGPASVAARTHSAANTYCGPLYSGRRCRGPCCAALDPLRFLDDRFDDMCAIAAPAAPSAESWSPTLSPVRLCARACGPEGRATLSASVRGWAERGRSSAELGWATRGRAREARWSSSGLGGRAEPRRAGLAEELEDEV